MAEDKNEEKIIKMNLKSLIIIMLVVIAIIILFLGMYIKENKDIIESNKIAIPSTKTESNNKEFNEDTQDIVKFKNNISIKDLFIRGFFKFSYRNVVVKKNFIITKCNHLFHSTCLEIWFERKKKCPTCRRDIYIN